MNINTGSYVQLSLTVASAGKLYQWASDQGIPNVFEAPDMHITVCFSTRPLHYVPLGRIPPLPVKPLALDKFGKEKNYIVLKVKSPLAENRHAYAMLSGAKHDFPYYRPHISLSKDASGIDISKIEPYPDLLFVNKETHTVLDPGFKPESLRVDPIAFQALMKPRVLEANMSYFKPKQPTPERMIELKDALKKAGVRARLKKHSGSLAYAVAIRLDQGDKAVVQKVGKYLGLISSTMTDFSDPAIQHCWNGDEINVYFTK